MLRKYVRLIDHFRCDLYGTTHLTSPRLTANGLINNDTRMVKKAEVSIIVNAMTAL